MRIEILTKANSTISLFPIRESNNIFKLTGDNNQIWMDLELSDNKFQILWANDAVDLLDDSLNAKLDKLLLEVLEAEQSGTENNESSENEEISPFNPDDIKVNFKQFGLRLISEMIDDEDIDLSPDFQRNFVWSSVQKSRLIESILLRIPLPMFYFSEDIEGKISVVDGLQRITTIKEFMDNKFPLKSLEYLKESCEGKYFRDEGRKVGIESKYVRWFNQTQFSVNVIDPTSPSKVKYDIFRRINTGGKPLNNQEIRNCLAGNRLRDVLREMVSLPSFKTATDGSIKPTRMDDQEIALRFILFYRINESVDGIHDYNGYMDTSLDNITEELTQDKSIDLDKYVSLFSNAMNNAEYLLGRRYAFRKVRPNDLLPGASKQLINKALFVSLTVHLADYRIEDIISRNSEYDLLNPIANLIESDQEMLYYLSYGTNGRNNLIYIFEKIKALINSTLNLDNASN